VSAVLQWLGPYHHGRKQHTRQSLSTGLVFVFAGQLSAYSVREDVYELVMGMNRVLLLFDYASHIAISKYRDMAGKTSRLHASLA
jgi:hypothetical protein